MIRRVYIAALWSLVGQVALAQYSISVDFDVSISVSPLESALDNSSHLTYSGATGSQITVYVDKDTPIPTGLTLELYPTNLPEGDTSAYTPPAEPLNLSEAVRRDKAKVFITLGADRTDQKVTLNYKASVTWDVPAGTLPAVTVIFTIKAP